MERIERDSFVFYKSFYDALKSLDDANIKWKIVEAICEYGLNGNEIELDAISRMAFNLVRPQLDANNKRYLNGKKGASYGSLGGRPKIETPDKPLDNPKKTPKKPQENPRQTPNVNDNVNVNENVNGNVNDIIKEKKNSLLKEKKSTRFVRPSVEDIKNYLKEKGWEDIIDAEYFWNSYNAKGWLVGKTHTPMKSWKSCCQTWVSNRKKPEPVTTSVIPDKVCEENEILTEEEILAMIGE